MDKGIDKKKSGVVVAIFPIFTIFVLIILFSAFLLFTQVINIILSIKTDLFYILKNALVSINNVELSYEEYSIDEERLIQTINTILNNNYIFESSLIKSIEIKELIFYDNLQNALEHTNGRYNVPIIHVSIEVKFSSIINLPNTNNEFNIFIHEDIKITLLEYGGD